MRIRRFILHFFILCVALLYTNTIMACCHEDEDETLALNENIYASTPDFPLNRFIEGKLGMIHPKMGGTFLLTAYRYLNQQPLRQNEKLDLMDFWRSYFSAAKGKSREQLHLLFRYDLRDTNYSTLDLLIDATSNKDAPFPFTDLQKDIPSILYKDYLDWHQTCLSALKQHEEVAPLTLDPKKIHTPKEAFTHIKSYYQDLAIKANEYAVMFIPLSDGMNVLRFATLRLKKLSQEVHDPIILSAWIATQKAFFKKIDNNYNADDEIDKALALFPTNLPPLAQLEKNYFQAAKNFYAKKDPELILQSANQFAALASNKDYPFHEWANYLSNRARALSVFIQQSERLHEGREERVDAFSYTAEEEKSLKEVQNNLQLLIKSTKDGELQRAAHQYCEIISRRLTPGLFERLTTSLNNNITFDDLKDYVYISIIRSSYKDREQVFEKLIEHPVKNVIPTATDWIALYQLSEKNDDTLRAKIFTFAFHQWKLDKRHQAWLLIAINTLSHANPDERNEIIQTVLNTNSSYSSYIPLHAALLLQDDQLHFWSTAARKKVIDTTLQDLNDNEDFRSTIFFLTKRMLLIENTDDLLKHAFFIPGKNLHSFYFKETQPAAYFVPDYHFVMQQLPLSVLVRLSQSPYLPENYRFNMLITAWTRAVLLDNQTIENKIAPILEKSIPELAVFIHARMASRDKDEKETQFISALLRLHYLSPTVDLRLSNTWGVYPLNLRPIVMMENNHDFWPAGVLVKSKSLDISPAPFLTNEEKTEFWNEYEKLQPLPNGVEWVANEVIRLAKKYPGDPRYAELLARSVEETHGCAYELPPDLSRNAFLVLKKQYAENSWAKKTKYYY